VPAAGAPPWKEGPSAAAGYPWFGDYVRVLERFPLLLERRWQAVPESGGRLGYFGGPEHDARAMPALVDATVALAALVSEPSYDARVSGVSPDRIRMRAIQALRYALVTHVTGAMKRPDGQAWGNVEHSGAWAARLAVAARALDRHLEEADREALRRVLGGEADTVTEREPDSRLLSRSAAPANARDAAVLAWAAVQPRAARATTWETAARDRMMNALSSARDRLSDRIVDGRPVREWVRTENVLPEYLLEDGGAVNPDAAFATLEALALARYAYVASGRTPPEAAAHGVAATWSALRRLWLFEERFAYPSGQDSPRQPVGPPSALAAAVAMQVAGHDAGQARALERALFRALEEEQAQNRDGTFFGARFSRGAGAGIEALLEAEAYGALALGLLMHRTTPRIIPPTPLEQLQRSMEGAWLSATGAVGAARTARAFASFSWRPVGGASGLIGLFVPPGGDRLVGWAPDQLAGSFSIEEAPALRVVSHRDRLLAGGFNTTGRILEGVRDGKPGLIHGVSWTALPDAGLGVLIDLTHAARDVRVTHDEGLQLAIVNDVIDGNRRTLRSDDGAVEVTGVRPDAKEEAAPVGARWVNVDGRLGAVLAYGQQPFTLRDFSAREQLASDRFHSLLHERLVTPYRTEPTPYRAGQVVRDTTILLVAGDVAATRLVAERSRVAATGQELLRALRVVGARGHQYLIVANFADHEQTVRLRPPGEALAPLLDLRLGPLETQVIGE
jgi:hypothetical protein